MTVACVIVADTLSDLQRANITWAFQNVSYTIHLCQDLQQAIQEIDADVVVLASPDQLFTTPLYSAIQRVQLYNRIVVTEQFRGYELLDKNYQFIYPRIASIASVVPMKVLRAAMDVGVKFGSDIQHPEVLHFLATSNKLLHMQPTQQYRDSVQLLEFSLWCYLNNIQAEKVGISVHFSPSEMSEAAVYGMLLGDVPTDAEWIDYLKREPDLRRIQFILRDIRSKASIWATPAAKAALAALEVLGEPLWQVTLHADLEYKDVLVMLNKHDVQYMVAGSVVLTAYGCDRVLGDFDIVYSTTRSNIDKLQAALLEISPNAEHLDILHDAGAFAKLYLPFGRVDLGRIYREANATFEEVYDRSVVRPHWDVPAHTVSLADMCSIKAQVKRPHDFTDIAWMQKQIEILKENKVACIVFASGAAETLRLQLKNLAFAMRGLRYEVHIYSTDTALIVELPKDCYLHIVEPNRISGQFLCRDIYDIDVPVLVAADPSIDVLVFSQQDQYWVEPIAEYVAKARKTGTIVMTDEYCGFEIVSSDYKKLFYPRIHDVGTIIPADYVRRAKIAGARLDSALRNPKILQRLTTESDKLLNFVPLSEYPGKHRIEQMLEFSLFCYYNGYPWQKRDMLVHFGGTDRIARLYPHIKDKSITADELTQLATRVEFCSTIDHVGTTIAHMVLCGEIELTEQLQLYLRESAAKAHIVSIYQRLQDAVWLDTEERERVAFLLTAITSL